MERNARAKLDRALLAGERDTRHAEVTLSFDGRTRTERAACEGPGTPADLRAVARATIGAARSLSDERFSGVVQLADVTEVCGAEFAIVNAMLYAGGRSVPVLGSCLLRGDVAVAAARATLDAVNRWLDLSLHGYDLEGFDELEAFGSASGGGTPGA